MLQLLFRRMEVARYFKWSRVTPKNTWILEMPLRESKGIAHEE